MPTYTINDPESGKSIKVTGDSPPTEKELGELFASQVDTANSSVATGATLTPAMAGLRQEAQTPGLNPVEQVGIAVEGMYQKSKDMLTTMGLRGAPVALGEVAGQRIAGKPGAFLGREGGAIIGSLLDQMRLVAQGKQKGVEGGQIVADMASALLPAKYGKASAGSMSARGAIQGGLNVAGDNAAAFIDDRDAPSLKQNLAQFSSGLASPFVQAGVERALGAKGRVPTKWEETLGPGQYESFRSVRKYGIQIPPSEIGRGSDFVSSISGKAAERQQAARNNVFGFQKMVNESVGIKDSARPLFDSDLENIRKQNYAPYEKIKEISSFAKEKLDAIMAEAPKAIDGPSTAARQDFMKAKKGFIDPLLVQAAADVDELKIVRNMAAKARTAMSAGDPTAYDKLQGHLAKMDSLNENILQAAALSGDKNLLKELNAARQKIAVSYSAQDVINPATGLAIPAKAGAKVLGREVGFREMEFGKQNDSPLKKMGDFALSFHPEAVEATRVPAANVNNLNPHLQLGMLSHGTPQGVFAAAMSKMGAPARAFNLSDFMQNRLVAPQLETGWSDFSAQLAQRMTAQAAK